MEIWLRTNARAVLFGMALPLAVGLVGLGFWFALPSGGAVDWLRVVSLVVAGLALATLLALAWQLKQPRLAYQDRHLLVWLRSGPPLRVPIEAVECFWLGQGASLLPGKRHAQTETATIVIRIAERATEWRHQEVKPQLGSWCEGYVTIRGTWCEPLSIDLVNRLNRRLAEVTRAHAGQGSGL